VASEGVSACNLSCQNFTFIQDAEGCSAALEVASACAADSECDDTLATTCATEFNDAETACPGSLPTICEICDSCQPNRINACRAQSIMCLDGGMGQQMTDCCSLAASASGCL
jgi:hypothetical protein